MIFDDLDEWLYREHLRTKIPEGYDEDWMYKKLEVWRNNNR